MNGQVLLTSRTHCRAVDLDNRNSGPTLPSSDLEGEFKGWVACCDPEVGTGPGNPGNQRAGLLKWEPGTAFGPRNVFSANYPVVRD